MPYVDEGPPKDPMKLPPVVPYLAIALAMGVGIALFWFFYTQMNLNQWLAPILVGPLVGLAMRLSSKQPLPHAGKTAIFAALAACLIGYVVRHIAWIIWLDPTFQPTVGHAFEWLFSADMQSCLLIAMSAYLAFAIAPKTFSGPQKAGDDA